MGDKKIGCEVSREIQGERRYPMREADRPSEHTLRYRADGGLTGPRDTRPTYLLIIGTKTRWPKALANRAQSNNRHLAKTCGIPA